VDVPGLGVEVIVVVVIGFNLPFSSSGVPWEDDFEWSLFNYTPVVTGGLFAIVGHLVAGERAQHVQGPAYDGRGTGPRSRGLEVHERHARGPRARHRGGARRDPARGRGGGGRRRREGEGGVPAWRAVAPAERSALLHRLADALDGEREALAQLEARNAGKPIGDARGEMGMVVETFRYYAGGPSGCWATRSRWPAASA
jgi:hypothetical protein